jgi:hypothetical protein
MPEDRQATVLVRVSNPADSTARRDLALRFEDRVVNRTAVVLPAGGERTVRFHHRVADPGTYNASVAGRTARLRVTHEEPTLTPREDEAGHLAFGFGPLLAVAVVLILALIAGATVYAVREEGTF